MVDYAIYTTMEVYEKFTLQWVNWGVHHGGEYEKYTTCALYGDAHTLWYIALYTTKRYVLQGAIYYKALYTISKQ